MEKTERVRVSNGDCSSVSSEQTENLVKQKNQRIFSC